MMTKILVPAVAVFGLVSCSMMKKDDDTGYDTADPYGAPDYGAETASYEAVNPPAGSYQQAPAYESTTPAPAPAPTASARSHTVAKGDTLWGLSRQYGVPVTSIQSANGMTGDTIRVGETVQIPAQ